MEQKQIFSSSVYDQMPPMSANHQWCVAQNLDAEDETQVQIIFSVHDPLRHYFRCQIPQLLGKHVRGCFYGWVILSDHPHNVLWSLWNPVTSKVIKFPRLIFKQSDSDDDIEHCCLTSPPDDRNSILLMTRSQKPHFVFCRLHPKNKKRKWTEMSYAKLVKKVAGEDDFLKDLTCCNGKVYAFAFYSWSVLELSIVVRDTGVVINLLPLVKFPDLCLNCNTRCYCLVGTCKDLFIIPIDFDFNTVTICGVHLFKLHMDSKTWEEVEDLKDATIILQLDGYLYPKFHSLAIGSELGGYIHIFGKNGGIIYSYHVKDKTISLSSVPCLEGTIYVSTWALLECKRLLEGDDNQEEDKKDMLVQSKFKSHEVEFIGTTYESHLLDLPFDVLEMIMAFSVGVEYINFRASCKLCYLAAPIVIQWSNQTSLKRRLQLQEYSLVSPWLMVFGKHTITLFDPMFGDKYFIKTPRELGLMIDKLRIHCSRYGWLLMRQYDGPLFFFNPFTSDTRTLPEVVCYLDSFNFSAPPTSSDCLIVGFTTANVGHVHIHIVGRESSWRRYVLPYGNNDPDVYRFPAFHCGDVYALCNDKGVDVFKDLGLGGDISKWNSVVVEAPKSSCTSKAHHFLVKCDHEYICDQHLLRVIVGEFGESVEVFILNEVALKWEEIGDIGRHMIYIGDKTCLCMEAKTSKMENKIYFPRLHAGKIVLYSFETRKFHTCDGGNISETFTDFFGTRAHIPHNAWIEPAWS